jgi:putrescine transport system permease protein
MPEACAWYARPHPSGDWPVASAVAIVMLLLLIVPIMWFHKHQQKQMGDHG